MTEEIDYGELWRQQREEREARAEKRRARIREALDNSDGFERLEAISDEEWNAAQKADDEAAAAALGELEEPGA